MRISFVNGLLVTCAVVLAVSTAEDLKPPNTTSTPTTTSNVPTTTSSATNKTTTATTTLSTTQSPSSSTPDTTTSSGPTTEPSTTVTAAPTTVTSAPPTTPKPPSPPPAVPEVYKWRVRNSTTNNTCILLKAGIRMTFNYTNGSKPVEHFSIDVPASGNESTATGDCKSPIQRISIIFFEGWNLSLTFTLNHTVKKYDMAEISLKYKIDAKHFPGAIENKTHIDTKKVSPEIFVDEKKGYSCKAQQSLYSNTTHGPGLIEIFTRNLQFEAFRNSTTDTFTNAINQCSKDEVSQLVPIIVGAVLAGLIIVVLIAYLIGRRRSRRGYESV